MPFAGGRWFTVSDTEGTLLLAGVDAQTLRPDELAPGFDYGDLGVEEIALGCEALEHESACGMAERQALEVSWDGLTSTISDGNSDFVGELLSYAIVVDSALDFAEVDCDDFPSHILRAMFFLIPEG